MGLTTVSFDVTPQTSPQYYIQGIKCDSVNEYYIAIGLDKLKQIYTYQYAINGGRALIGGMILDFAIWTKPVAMALFIDEAYWHSGEAKQRDMLLRARLDQLAPGQFIQRVLTGQDTDAEDKALSSLRRLLL